MSTYDPNDPNAGMDALMESMKIAEPVDMADANYRITPVFADGEKIDDMVNILRRLNESTDKFVIKTHTQPNRIDNEILKESLVTSRTERGSRVGKWEIVAVNEGGMKTFDVVGEDGQPIASQLYLYEAALALAKGLNSGITINDPRINKILYLEETYVRKRNDAAEHKRTYQRSISRGDGLKASIAESRYDDSASKARAFADEMAKLAGLKR